MANSPRLRIHILHCGTMRVPRRLPEGGAARGARVTLPVSAYLIEHPRHGRLLLDTGWPRSVSPAGVYDAAAARALLPAALAAFYEPCVPPGQAVDEQLAALGLTAADIDCVLLSHLDCDHVAALGALRGARRFLAAEEEYFWSRRTVFALRQPSSLWESVPLERLYYYGSPLGPRGRCADVFGDESVLLVNTSGHTMGHFSLLLRQDADYVILAGDAAFSRRSWETGALPGYGFDGSAQRRALDWLRECSRDPHCKAILANHDAAVTPAVIEL